MGRKRDMYILNALVVIDLSLLFVNFLAAFIFSLFLIMVIVSSGGYGSPEGKWQAYTTGTGNWRIGGVAARGEDYNRTLSAENAEKSRLGAGGIYILLIVVVMVVSFVGMSFGYGSVLAI